MAEVSKIHESDRVSHSVSFCNDIMIQRHPSHLEPSPTAMSCDPICHPTAAGCSASAGRCGPPRGHPSNPSQRHPGQNRDTQMMGAIPRVAHIPSSKLKHSRQARHLHLVPLKSLPLKSTSIIPHEMNRPLHPSTPCNHNVLGRRSRPRHRVRPFLLRP